MDDLLNNQLFATHAVVAAASVALGTTVTYPLDSIKVLLQVGSSSSKQLNSLLILNRVVSLSGFSGLYNGFGWMVSGRILGMGVRFGIYEILTAFYKDGRKNNHVYVSEALIAGMTAGAVESLLSSPFELLKLRAQVSSACSVPDYCSRESRVMKSPASARLLLNDVMNKNMLNQSLSLLSILRSKHPNLSSSLQEYPWMMTGSGMPPPVWSVRKPSEVISLEGCSALWRGLRAGFVRDTIFGGVFFCGWQFLYHAMVTWKAVGMDPIPRSDEEVGPLSPLSVSVAAGISGSVAAAASQCFDTARCRSLCTVLPKYVSMERKMLKWRRPGTALERATGLHPADRKLLFTGMKLRIATSGVLSSLVVGGYYFTIRTALQFTPSTY